MTNTIDERIAVMQAFRDGKKIEFKLKTYGCSWSYIPHPSWDWNDCDYREMPPKPREFWLHMDCPFFKGRAMVMLTPCGCLAGETIHVREVLP